MSLSPSDLESIRLVVRDEVRPIVRDEVSNVLKSAGVDVEQPLEAQADMRFVRLWRTGAESGFVRAVAVVVTMGLVGAVAAVVAGLKSGAPPS